MFDKKGQFDNSTKRYLRNELHPKHPTKKAKTTKKRQNGKKQI